MNRFENSLSLSGLFSGENKKPSIILLFVPLVLILWKYYGSTSFYFAHLSGAISFSNDPAMTAEWYTFVSAFVLMGILSALVVKVGFREPLSAYGLQIGDWKFWIPATLVIGLVMIALAYPSSKDVKFLAEYPIYKGAGTSASTFAVHCVAYLFFYIGWEMLFRGFVQYGLANRFGAWGAILIQSALSCIAHIGKPDSEAFTSLLGALVWGILVFRSRSLWPAIITHWMLGVSLDFFICFT